jgi:hypothetical protein
MDFINSEPQKFKYCVVRGNEAHFYNQGFEEYNTDNDTALIDVNVWMMGDMLYISGTCELSKFYLEKDCSLEDLKYEPLEKYICTPLFSGKKYVKKGYYEVKRPYKVKLQISNPIIKIY